jgi:hypothetical protein
MRRENPPGLAPSMNKMSGNASKQDRTSVRQQVKDRALSRFGMQMGKLVRQDLVRRVQKGDVKYARRLTNSRTVIVLDYAGEERAFLYSSATKEILCFLPPNAPETADWRHSESAALKLQPRREVRPRGVRK